MRLYPWLEALQSPVAQTFEQDARYENQVNRWRVLLILFLSAVPLSSAIDEGFFQEQVIGFAAIGLILLYSLAVHLMLKRNQLAPAVKYFTVGMDTTAVTGILFSLMFVGRSIAATNSQVANAKISRYAALMSGP